MAAIFLRYDPESPLFQAILAEAKARGVSTQHVIHDWLYGHYRAIGRGEKPTGVSRQEIPLPSAAIPGDDEPPSAPGDSAVADQWM